MKEEKKERSVLEQVVLDLGGTVINLERIDKKRTRMDVKHGFRIKSPTK